MVEPKTNIAQICYVSTVRIDVKSDISRSTLYWWWLQHTLPKTSTHQTTDDMNLKDKKKNPFPHPGGGGDLKFYMEYEVMRQNTILWIHQLPFSTRLLGLLRFPVSSRFRYTASSLPPRPIASRALYESPLSCKDSWINPFSSALQHDILWRWG